MYDIIISEIKEEIIITSTKTYENYVALVNSNKLTEFFTSNTIFFNPRKLTNLKKLSEEIFSLGCVTDFVYEDLLKQGSPQLYCVSGKNSRSTLRVLTPNLKADLIQEINIKNALNIWALPLTYDSNDDYYLVVNFHSETKVLKMENGLVKDQCNDILYKNDCNSLLVDILVNNSYVQVITTGFYHNDVLYKTNSQITCAHTNGLQIVLSLKDREILYFDLDKVNNKFKQIGKIESNKIDSNITCVCISPIQINRDKGKLLACGFEDKYVRIFSLENQSLLLRLSMQEQSSTPMSLCFQIKEITETDIVLSLITGNSQGVITNSVIDSFTGAFSDVKLKSISSSNINHNRNLNAEVYMLSKSSILATSNSKPLLMYYYLGKEYTCSVQLDEKIKCVCGIRISSSLNFFIGNEESLKLYKIDLFQFGNYLHCHQEIKLKYTPRKIVYSNKHNSIFVLESDQNILTEKTKIDLKSKISIKEKDKNKQDINIDYLSLKEDDIGVPSTINDFNIYSIINKNKKDNLEIKNSKLDVKFSNHSISNSTLKALNFSWASCIRIINPLNLHQTDLELEGNEAALSMCIMNFSGYEETFLVVSTSKNFQITPKCFKSCSLLIFNIKENNKLEYLSRTYVDDVPQAVCEFKGKLAVGVGATLVLYDLGKKQLIKSIEAKKISSQISKIQVVGDRIFVNTINESVIGFRYYDDKLVMFVDDIEIRWPSSLSILDENTVCIGDKFENFAVLRVNDISENVRENLYNKDLRYQIGTLGGAVNKFNNIINFHVGQMITSLNKVNFNSLNEDENSLIVYSTSLGTIGVFIPIQTKEEIEFLTHLEMYMRLEYDSLTGRSHKAYRSLFNPVKCIIDGDLLEAFNQLDPQKIKSITNEIGIESKEINQKLSSISSKFFN